MSNKPSQRIVLKPSKPAIGEDGQPERPPSVMVAWPNRYGGFDWKLQEGWTLTSPDGEVFTTGREGNCYLNGYSDEQKRKHEEKQEVDYDDDGRPFGGDDSDLPF